MNKIAYTSALAALAIYACSDATNDSLADGSAGSSGAAGAAGTAGARDAAADQQVDAGPICPEMSVIETPSPPDPGTPAPAPSLDCGTPTFPAGTGLRRYPYLQSISTDSARVAWTTTTSGSGRVRFGPSSSGPWTDVAADPRLFSMGETTDTVDYTAFVSDLTGLDENSAYCYEVWEDGVALATGLRFDTAWTGADRPVQMLAFGDSGQATPEQFGVRDEFMKHEFDLFLHLGDMAYGDGTFPEFEEKVFDVYKEFLHRVPTYPTIGNHEYKTRVGRPYLDVYYLWEQALRPEQNERYYSFDYGNIHFVSLDSNDLMLIPIAIDLNDMVKDDMVDWLKVDLASSNQPWKIAIFHHPPFTSSERGFNSQVINVLLPTLQEGGIDLVMVGHDHHYERTYPMRGDCGEVVGGRDAIPYIIAGGGGAGLRPATGGYFTANVQDQTNSFLRFTVHGCRGVGQAIDLNGVVFDDFEIDGCD